MGAPVDGGGVSLTVALADWLAGAGVAPGVTGRIFKVLAPGAAAASGAAGAGASGAGASGAAAGSDAGLAAAAPGRMMLIFMVGEALLGAAAGVAGAAGASAAAGASGAVTFKAGGAASAGWGAAEGAAS